MKECNDNQLKQYLSILVQLTTIAGCFLDPLKPMAKWKQSPAEQVVNKLAKDCKAVNFENVCPEFVKVCF
jgi:hypothetical protein